MRSRFDRRVICPHAGALSVKIFVRPRERSFLESFSSLHFLAFQTRETAGRGRGSRLSAGRVRPGLTGGERFEKDLATAFFVLADATH
jgi:hypothetical protein